VSEKRALTEKLVRDIARDYANHQKVLAGILRPFAEMRATPAEIRGVKARTQEIIRRLDVLAVRWAKASIEQAYKSKRSEVEVAAKRAAVFTEGKETNPGRRPTELIERTAADFVAANRSISSTVHRFLAAYEKAAAGVASAGVQAMTAEMEAEVSRKVDYYLARGYDEGSISRKLRAYLEKLVGGDDFIEINGRFYGLKAFAEQLARSELHDAYVEATLDECAKWDCDLVQFSRHDSPCPICAQLEGKVFSIGGGDPDFPPLDNPVDIEVQTKTEIKTIQVDPKKPHPNCEHNMDPVTREILRANGELG
jgi:hypothetical protein